MLWKIYGCNHGFWAGKFVNFLDLLGIYKNWGVIELSIRLRLYLIQILIKIFQQIVILHNFYSFFGGVVKNWLLYLIQTFLLMIFDHFWLGAFIWCGRYWCFKSYTIFMTYLWRISIKIFENRGGKVVFENIIRIYRRKKLFFL